MGRITSGTRSLLARLAPPERIVGLDLEGPSTVWLFDADQGGRTLRDDIHDGGKGVAKERLLLLKDTGDLEIEDIVEPAAYCTAVTNLAADLGIKDEFTIADLPSGPCKRPDAVAVWFKARRRSDPGKPTIANHVLDLAGDMPLLDPRHRQRLLRLDTKFRKILRLEERDAI